MNEKHGSIIIINFLCEHNYVGTTLLLNVAPYRVYEFTGLDYWTGLLDWTTGLIKKCDFTPF